MSITLTKRGYMKYDQFFSALQQNQNTELELEFEFDHGTIRRSYHITEIISTTVQAIDCGGAVESWTETVLQLLEPKLDDGQRFMESTKALAILKKSAELIHIQAKSKLILEYKPENSSAAQRYTVEDIKTVDGKLIVTAAGSKTQCKAAVRKNTSQSCCGPTLKTPSTNKSLCC